MSETMILTSRGEMPESALFKTEGGFENDVEKTTWQEWIVIGDPTGEVVKRDVQIALKPLAATGETGVLG